MNKKDLEAAKGIKTEKDLTDMGARLTKIMVDAAQTTAAMVSRAKPCTLKMAILSWIHHVTDKVILSRS